MTALVLSMPDESAALPGWLDRQLVGPDLGQLVAELTAVHGPPPAGSPRDVREVLGDRLQQVLADGLSAARPSAISSLLKHPRLLLDLQELAFTQGGPHWQSLPTDRRLAATADAVWVAFRPRLVDEPVEPAPLRPAMPVSTRTAWYRRPEVVSLATAAAVLLAVFVGNQFRDRGQQAREVAGVQAGGIGWGWAKPGAVPAEASPEAYLTRLADGAEEWFAKKPDRPAALAKRINEFRTGCSALIFSEHAPLSPDDKKWLVERCRSWAAKLDAHLQALEQGKPAAEVQAEVDQTARQMATALRSRADAVRAAS